MGLLDIVKAGVVSGDELNKVYEYAKAQGFAIPAVNVVGTDSINAVLEAAKSKFLLLSSNFLMEERNLCRKKLSTR